MLYHIEAYWPCRFGKPFTLANDADNFSMLQYCVWFLKNVLCITSTQYWNVLNLLDRQMQVRLVDARPPVPNRVELAFNTLQYCVEFLKNVLSITYYKTIIAPHSLLVKYIWCCWENATWSRLQVTILVPRIFNPLLWPHQLKRQIGGWEWESNSHYAAYTSPFLTNWNIPTHGQKYEDRTHDSGITTRGFTTKLTSPYVNTLDEATLWPQVSAYL